MTASTVLYWVSGSAPCWRVLAVLKQKNIEFDSKFIDGKQIKSPEVLALNPRGQVPAFKDGDVVVNESMAAMQYLEEAYPDVPLMPKDLATRAAALQRFHEGEVLYSAVVPLFFSKMVGLVKTEADEARFNEGIEKAKTQFAYFESYLKPDQEFLVGDMLTLADINLACVCLFAIRGGATLTAHPNLLAYVNRMKEQQCIKDTWPPHWKDSANNDWLKSL